MNDFSTVLIANRGEIAVRVMRTARALGYRTVAVYSDIDRDTPHVRLADRAVPIGPAPAAQSYLSIDRIIAAARHSGADAIHPGYGFLSENAAFARACAEAGIVFIGPPAEAIALMGNKARAKRRMKEAGVPCVPGYDGAAQDDATLAREALAIGLPVMIKAAAGGGGKGMRLVSDAARLHEALRAARAEAENAFGAGELIVEKAIAAARHVEIQVFADRHGNVIHLGERDCSIQRRHQKIIEEAPCPALEPALRERMGNAAVTAARTIGYVGAGTVEFLLARDCTFSFLEMNTRLQVEHPVTEMVTGLDLVEWQLRVAAGELLPLRQSEIGLSGHAIEARLYAEDASDFLPQAGTVLAFEPPALAGVRIDHGLAAGSVVSPYYDPMMAKLIAHGATREEARRRLVRALSDLVVLGVETNRQFLLDCLGDEAIRAGETSTAFIDERFPPGRRARRRPDGVMTALAAVLIERHDEVEVGNSLRHFRNAAALSSPVILRRGDERITVDLTSRSDGRHEVAWPGDSHQVEILNVSGPRVRFLADGLEQTAHAAFDRDVLHLSLDGVTAMFSDARLERRDAGDRSASGAALAPMTGTIAAVHVQSGDAVKKGQCLIILEAMKMQHEIVAPRDGTVAAVLVSVGQQVTTRKTLVELAE
jgi:geranyl-CoA carboxylase alpha subunit